MYLCAYIYIYAHLCKQSHNITGTRTNHNLCFNIARASNVVWENSYVCVECFCTMNYISGLGDRFLHCPEGGCCHTHAHILAGRTLAQDYQLSFIIGSEGLPDVQTLESTCIQEHKQNQQNMYMYRERERIY